MILELSAGGVGHVPIPLLLKPQEPLRNVSVASRRPYLVNYVGSMDHAPHDFRVGVRNHVQNLTNASFGWGKMEEWQSKMSLSRASLALRGYGRTSFHLAEIIQLGLIPIHVYDDIPWIPYRALFESDIGFIATLGSLPGVLETIRILART